MTRRTLPGALLAASLFASASSASDWPQWMGPNRDGVWPEAGVVKAFPAGGPKVVWRAPVQGGYSGPAVANGKVYVTDRVLAKGAADPKDPFDSKTTIPSTERVLCLDAKTGEKLWKHEYECPYQVSYPVGPRCTPTVADGKVYTLGTMGHLFCLDANSGKVIWEKNFPKDYSTKTPVWGFCGHPLVYKNLLICLVGGEGSVAVAFDKNTGKEVWKALSAKEPGYAPPTLIEAGGKTQVVIWHAQSINALNPDTGEKYWSVPLAPAYGMSIMAPRKSGDLLFAGGIGDAAVVLKLDADKPGAKEVWRGTKKNGVYPVNMTPFVEKDTIFAVDQPGNLRAVKLGTGERLWQTYKPVIGKDEDEGFAGAKSGTAFIVKNADRYFLFSETGDLVIAKLTAEKYEEVSRAHLLDPTSGAFGRKVLWMHPAFADKCVFARNDKEIVCWSLAE